MSKTLDIDDLKKKEFARRTRWLVLAESMVILGLLTWVSVEYQSNLYLQSWVTTNVGPIGFLLNGTLAGIYAGILLGYTMSKHFGKKTEEEKILESLKKKSVK
ncbi:MAG TPA: hypothetical protein VGS11_00820 [Candidatus Bathyarchaeia archaeon]|nr:hypothetical protein [Candidatus Bathyarchaeia archaeon]